MTADLSSRLKAALAFDSAWARAQHAEHMGMPLPDNVRSFALELAARENARLAPLHESLLAVVAAAEALCEHVGNLNCAVCDDAPVHCELGAAQMALAELRESVGNGNG